MQVVFKWFTLSLQVAGGFIKHPMSRGFWISPDGAMVAYEEVTEAHISQFRIMHSGSDSVGADAQEDHRYPFAGDGLFQKPPNSWVLCFLLPNPGVLMFPSGDENPKVKLCVVSAAAGAGDAAAGAAPKVTEFDLTGPFGEDFYLARVQWMPDGSMISQILNREQNEMAVLKLDAKTGSWVKKE